MGSGFNVQYSNQSTTSSPQLTTRLWSIRSPSAHHCLTRLPSTAVFLWGRVWVTRSSGAGELECRGCVAESLVVPGSWGVTADF